jgi:2-hydroxychromene-2-carboxylate isomerase
MKHITFYLDFISPYAYLAFEKLPEALMGLSYTVRYKPVLLGALLQHHGQLGPAEIPAKREWTYRHVEWLGQHEQVELQMPAVHPFNLNAGEPNRHVCETLFHHVWHGGADVLDAARLQALDARLPAHADPQSEAVKAQLKQQTDAAISAGVFGVPAFGVDDKVFWGLDALPMLRDYLSGDAWFDGPSWAKPAQIQTGILRKR